MAGVVDEEWWRDVSQAADETAGLGPAVVADAEAGLQVVDRLPAFAAFVASV